MANAKYKVQILTDAEWLELAPRIWRHVPEGVPYIWPIDERALARLADIAPGLALCEGMNDRDCVETLRSHLGPLMRAAPAEQLAAISSWIVTSWGGISDSSGAISDWAARLAGFSQPSIDAFVAERGKKRISSWSKILAFARPEHDAIYDSRTALTLNFALFSTGDHRRFVAPDGRPGNVATAAALIGNGDVCFGYRDYLACLRAFNGRSLSDLEGTLFAAAPVLASAFVARLDPHISTAAATAIAQAKALGQTVN